MATPKLSLRIKSGVVLISPSGECSQRVDHDETDLHSRLFLVPVPLRCFPVVTSVLLAGSNFLEPKVCEQSNPDCVFQTTSGGSSKSARPQTVSAESARRALKPSSSSTSFPVAKSAETVTARRSSAIARRNQLPLLPTAEPGVLRCQSRASVCDTTAGVCKACANDVECQSEGFVTCNGGLCSGCKSSADCKKPANPSAPYYHGRLFPCTMDAECSQTQLATPRRTLTTTRHPIAVSARRRPSSRGSTTTQAVLPVGMAPLPNLTAHAPPSPTANIGYIHLTKSTIPYALDGVNPGAVPVRQGDVPGDVIVSALSVNSGKLTLSNLSIKDTGKSLIACMGGSLVLSKTILDGGTRGVDALTGCTDVNIQQTKVLNATGIGISIAGSATYTIINPGVFRQRSNHERSGVSLVTSGSGKFAFNTIQNNSTGVALSVAWTAALRPKPSQTPRSPTTRRKRRRRLQESCTFTKVVVGLMDDGNHRCHRQDPMYSADGSSRRPTRRVSTRPPRSQRGCRLRRWETSARRSPRHRLSRSEVVFPPCFVWICKQVPSAQPLFSSLPSLYTFVYALTIMARIRTGVRVGLWGSPQCFRDVQTWPPQKQAVIVEPKQVSSSSQKQVVIFEPKVEGGNIGDLEKQALDKARRRGQGHGLFAHSGKTTSTQCWPVKKLASAKAPRSIQRIARRLDVGYVFRYKVNVSADVVEQAAKHGKREATGKDNEPGATVAHSGGAGFHPVRRANWKFTASLLTSLAATAESAQNQPKARCKL